MIVRSKAVVVAWLLLWAGSFAFSAKLSITRAPELRLGTESSPGEPCERAYLGTAGSERAHSALAASKDLPRAGNAWEQKVPRAQYLEALASVPATVALRAYELTRIDRSAAPLRAPFSTAPSRAPPARG